MTALKYAVITFGCRVNQADSLQLEEQLCLAGATRDEPELADLVVVNTCSVTATADQGARQTIRRLARTNPGARVVVTGCYATREPETVAALPGVSQVVVNRSKSQLVALLADEPTLSTAERFGTGEGSCGAPLEPGLSGRTAFTLRVQTGCAEACSYCIIPATRGDPSSVPLLDVLREVDRAAAAGFKEIVLTGVHLGSYGRDLTPRTCLAALLDRLASRATTDVLFRVSSLEPMDCTPDILDLVTNAPMFAPHFHLPLQHASDRILKAMHRPYRLAEYSELVGGIRERMPAASIGTDVIVGFPGECHVDFDELASYLDESPLTHLHVFPYSDRPGTVASRLSDRPAGNIVRERGRRVRDIGRHLAERFRMSQVGAVRRGLTIEDGSLVVTDNYLKVHIQSGRKRNERVLVRIGSADQICRDVASVPDWRC
jgi:threonylcarbamoyladenosine tRNA methylthiotransferase MtaB